MVALMAPLIEVTSAMLSSTSIPETPPTAWNSGTTYTTGQRVALNQLLNGQFAGTYPASTNQYVYESLQNSNLNKRPDQNASWWKLVGIVYDAFSDANYYGYGETVYDAASHKNYRSIKGRTIEQVTFGAATDEISYTHDHGLENGDTISMVSSNGSAITPFTANTIYYVVNKSARKYQVSATEGGAAITHGSNVTNIVVKSIPNIAHDLTDTDWWEYVGFAGPWAVFDGSNTTGATSSGSIQIVMQNMGRVDTVGLFGLIGASSVTILAMDGATTRYNQTYSLSDTSFSDDWFSAVYSQTIYKDTLAKADIPPYNNMTITITINAPTATDELTVGTVMFGLSKSIGSAQYQSRSRNQNFSYLERDTFGNITITERAYSRSGTFEVHLPASKHDGVQALFARYRAQPCLFIMTSDYTSGQLYAIIKDADFTFWQPEDSTYSLTLEGLT